MYIKKIDKISNNQSPRKKSFNSIWWSNFYAKTCFDKANLFANPIHLIFGQHSISTQSRKEDVFDIRQHNKFGDESLESFRKR